MNRVKLLFSALLVLVLPGVGAGSVYAAETLKTVGCKRPRVGLALGGGGTRGAAHIGVLRVLTREHIPIDCVAGTSMGAIVGGLYCAGVPLDTIEQRVLRKDMLHAYVTVPIPLRLAAIPIFFIPHLFGYHPYDGLYRGNKFRKYLDNAVPESRRNIEDLPVPFQAVASNLLDGRAVALSKGSLGKAIQASSAIPFLRRPVFYEHQLLVDGAIESNLPVSQAREMGADIVIAVPVDENVHIPQDPAKFRHILSTPHRVLSMLLCRLDEYEEKNADLVVSPDLTGIRLLSEKEKDAQRAIKAGEEATEVALPQIRARIAAMSAAGDALAAPRPN